MASSSTSRKKSKKAAKEVITLGSSDEEEDSKESEELSALQKKVTNVVRLLKRKTFSVYHVHAKYLKTYNEPNVPFANFGYKSLAFFLDDHPLLEIAPGAKNNFTFRLKKTLELDEDELGKENNGEQLKSLQYDVEQPMEKNQQDPSTLEEFHERVLTIARTLRSPFTMNQFMRKYERIYSRCVPVATFGYSSVMEILFFAKGICAEENGKYSLVDEDLSEENDASKMAELKTVQDKVVAVARTLRQPFSCSEMIDTYRWRYNEASIPFARFGFRKLVEFCRKHPVLEEVRGECGELLFKIRIEEEDDVRPEEASEKRLKMLQDEVWTAARILRGTLFSLDTLTEIYYKTYKKPVIPFAEFGYKTISSFLEDHPGFKGVIAKGKRGVDELRYKRMKSKEKDESLRRLQEKITAAVTGLEAPFSPTAVYNSYIETYNEPMIRLEQVGYKKLCSLLREHPDFEEVRDDSNRSLFKLRKIEQKKKHSEAGEGEDADEDRTKVSKTPRIWGVQEATLDLQSAGSEFGEDLPPKKRKRTEVLEEDGEKQSKVIKTAKLASEKKHKKDKTVVAEESVEAGRNEIDVAADLHTTESGEGLSKKKHKRGDEDKKATRSKNLQNDHGKEQSKTIKTEETSRKKKMKENRVEGQTVAAADSFEVLEEKPVKKEIVVEQTTLSNNENTVATESHDPTLVTAPFAPQMPPMAIHFPPMMSFAPPPSRHAILGNFIAQMLEHAEYRGQNADEIGSKLLQVINDSNKPTG